MGVICKGLIVILGNIAYGKQVIFGGTNMPAASPTVDGDTSSASCAESTNQDSNTQRYWRVDLGDRYVVTGVTIIDGDANTRSKYKLGLISIVLESQSIIYK